MGRVPRAAAALLALVPAAAGAAEIDADVAFAELDPPLPRLVEHLRILAGAEPLLGAPLRSRHVLHSDLARAEDYVQDALAALPGVATWRECLTASVELDGGAVVEAPSRCTILAELPGADPALPPLVLGAHLDSTAKATPGWEPTTDPAPGADDDASGVAAILVLAEALAARGAFGRTVRFVLFTAEEVGLQGSFAHVDALQAAGEEVSAMLQLDPVGYDGGDTARLWFSYDARWPELRDAAEAAAVAIGSPLLLQGVDAALIGGDARSDHYPFWQAGMPALHFGAFPPPPDYHRVTDTVDVVDPEFLTDVTLFVGRLAVGLLAPCPLPTAPPPDDPPPADPPPGPGCASTPAPAGTAMVVVVVAAVARRRRAAR